MRWSMVVGLAAASAGCDNTFGLVRLRLPVDARSDGASIPGADAPDAPPGCTVIEHFADGIDGLAMRWSLYQTAPASAVTIESEQLVTKLAPNVEAFALATTLARYDLTKATLSVRVDSIAGPGETETYLAVRLDDSNAYIVTAWGGTMLGVTTRFNGNTVMQNKSYTQPPLYWRIQHRPSFVDIATSADGTTWQPMFTVAEAAPLSAMQIRLGAGAFFTGAGTATEARFDEVMLCR